MKVQSKVINQFLVETMFESKFSQEFDKTGFVQVLLTNIKWCWVNKNTQILIRKQGLFETVFTAVVKG